MRRVSYRIDACAKPGGGVDPWYARRGLGAKATTTPHRRTIVSHLSWDAFEPGVVQALRALDYDIVPAGKERTAAELLIVDDEILERLDNQVVAASPLLLLNAHSSRRCTGPRVTSAREARDVVSPPGPSVGPRRSLGASPAA